MAYDPDKGLEKNQYQYNVKKKGHGKMKLLGAIALTALVTTKVVNTKATKDKPVDEGIKK